MLESIHHIAIICSDYEASKTFYADKLGLEILSETYRKALYVLLRPGRPAFRALRSIATAAPSGEKPLSLPNPFFFCLTGRRPFHSGRIPFLMNSYRLKGGIL